MLALRILGFPIAMAVFTVLYVIATKSPEAVEVGSLLMWPLLAITLLVRASRRVFQIATGK